MKEYLGAGKIKGIKAGLGWRVLKSELDRLRDETKEIKPPEMSPQGTIEKSDPKMPRPILRWRVGKKIRVRNCLKCGRQVILEEGFFLCESCRKSNSLVEDLGSVYQSYLSDVVRTFRLGQINRNF